VIECSPAVVHPDVRAAEQQTNIRFEAGRQMLVEQALAELDCGREVLGLHQSFELVAS
jgi:hypothetical protein